MASLKDLRDRISSVKATQKITKAMQMVAAAKLRRAQEAAEAARPYSQYMQDIFSIAITKSDKVDLPSIMQQKEDKRYLLVVCTADRGLCGGFNSQIARFTKLRITSLLAEGKEVKLITVGKKGADLLRREFSDLFLEELSFRDVPKISYKEAGIVFEKIEKLFFENSFDICELIYSHFVSVISQNPVKKQLIPALENADFSKDFAVGNAKNASKSAISEASPIQDAVLYETEPMPEDFLESLVEQYLRQQIFSALLENAAGEMGAKMAAMDNATRNAGEMIDQLSITYNRQRQAQITTELVEIIAGAQAL